MEIRFTYKTYQDVRRNLFFYSIPVLVLAGFLDFFFILPAGNREAISSLAKSLTDSPVWKGVLNTGCGLIIFILVAFLLTEILQVHDRWYDKYVVRWRERYDTDFILPRLIQPFSSGTNYRFYEEAEQHAGRFLEDLYYPFVGDRDVKIPKNKLLRFYEVVTIYWLTQINEIVLISAAVLVLYFRFAGPADLGYRTHLLDDSIAVCVLWILNRVWVWFSRNSVRNATEDEIRAIHANLELKAELEQRLIRLCKDYSIPYGQVQD